MNAIISSVGIMLLLSFLRFNIVLSLLIGAIAGGLLSGLDLNSVLTAFHSGLGAGANIALSYGMLGAFALAISATKIPDFLMYKLITKLEKANKINMVSYYLIFTVFLIAVMSQNVFPIHIAFIPILIPPLLPLFNMLQLDRRIIAIALTTGLTATYLVVPVGFGDIYIRQVLAHNLNISGLAFDYQEIPKAMIIPVTGMLVGFIIAIFRYNKPRKYNTNGLTTGINTIKRGKEQSIPTTKLIATLVSVVAALAIQFITNSMILCAAIGFSILIITGSVPWKQANCVFTDGMKTMSACGFIMITAAGFAAVLRETGDIPKLVLSITQIIDGSKGIGALLMLLIGLGITMGIGSSFSTVPIIASLYVPLCFSLGFSPLATVALVGAAGALGDAGSPASEATIGPTFGLNMDNNHDHIRDSVIPTFLYLNIPMIIFSWIAVMML